MQMNMTVRHQYIERDSGAIRTEQLYGDRFIKFIYNGVRENAPLLFRLLTGAHASSLLGMINFDAPLAGSLAGNRRFLAECGVDFGECLQPPGILRHAAEVFRAADPLRGVPPPP